MAKQPIRVFHSPLTGRFYATRRWREIGPGRVEVTGEKFDVTDDIGDAVVRRGLSFEQIVEPATDGADAVTVRYRTKSDLELTDAP